MHHAQDRLNTREGSALTQIHATALIDRKAEVDAGASVGPYTVIGPHVRVGAGTSIGAHCVIEGHTTIGRDNRIFQFNSLGAMPQDKKYKGEPCKLLIGDRNTIREFCTFNIGSPGAVGVTRIGGRPRAVDPGSGRRPRGRSP